MKTKINQFLEWYKRADVKFELIKFLQNREFACLVPSWCPNDMKKTSTRTLRCHNVDHLDVILWRILDVEYKKNLYNLYYSMAEYSKGIPYQNPNLAERDNRSWVTNHYKEMIRYDWLIDIDADELKDIDRAYDVAKGIKKLLDHCSIPYEIRFSGKGFHFVIPYRVFAYLNHHFDAWEDGNIFKFLTNCSKALHKLYGDMIDWKIPDSRRVCKIPYSLAFYEHDTFVCMPFCNPTEFNNFKLEKMTPDNWGSVRNRYGTVFNEIEVPRFSLLLSKIGMEVR